MSLNFVSLYACRNSTQPRLTHYSDSLTEILTTPGVFKDLSTPLPSLTLITLDKRSTIIQFRGTEEDLLLVF